MDLLKGFGRAAERVVVWLSRATNAVGLFALVLMAILTFVDVFGRAFFNSPITGAYELTELLFITVVALVLGYSVISKVHIRIDLLVSRFPPGVQHTLDIISHLVTFIFFVVVGWRVAAQAINMQNQGTYSGILAIPIFPFTFILAFGYFLMGIMYLVETVKTITEKQPAGSTTK